MDKPNIDKVKLESSNIADENFEKLASLFPNVVTETIVNDRVERVIDVDKLKQEINSHVVEGLEERYNFTWPDKRKSAVLANAPTRNTLRACKEESKDFDKTENLYIEGDNLEVLKLLRNTYLGQVKMIYIDPPYNTGKDFVYQDNFYINKEDYKEMSGQIDEEGNRLFENTEANGRFHTDWLNMMYPRLKMARDLLTDDGAIFISIDETEVANLKKMCDEIFGKDSVEIYIWDIADFSESSFTKTASSTVRYEHEYIIACYRNIKKLGRYKEYRFAERTDFSNPDNDPRGEWMSGNISRNGIKSTTGSKYYTIKTPTGEEYTRNWTISQEEYKNLLADNRIFFSKEGSGVPRLKIFKSEPSFSIQSSVLKGLKSSITGKKQIIELFNGIELFDFPKPINLIHRFAQLVLSTDDIILDFFSGSATTAHAVMQLNAEDGGE